jgi:hypothetical protein
MITSPRYFLSTTIDFRVYSLARSAARDIATSAEAAGEKWLNETRKWRKSRPLWQRT